MSRCQQIAWVFVAGAGLLLADPAVAKTIEETVTLQAEAQDVRGRLVSQPIQVTIYRDEARRVPQPFMILNHGRSAKAAERAKTAVGPYGPNARYFVSRGFAVFVPMRIGYGATGGPDVEDSGACAKKIYPPVYEAAAQQSLVVFDYAKARPYVDPSRGLVVGQSFGGTTALTLAAKGLPGVLGAVNFAGGGGGNPTGRPENPCRTDLLLELFSGYGATARIPTLWLYSENDRYMGPKYPREWFDGFVKAGGNGRFVLLPPYKQDGHPSFTGQPAAWRPEFEAFLKQTMGR
jgi:dienelactone hydrolase